MLPIEQFNGSAAVSNAVFDAPVGPLSFEDNGYYYVANIVSKSSSTKEVYKAAVVSCPLKLSPDTYNAAKSKLSIFLGKNKDLTSLVKNADKEGYTVRTIYRMAPDAHNIQAVAPSGPEDFVYDSKDAVRWIFDEAKEGNVSAIYDCGQEKDHILVVGLSKIHKDGYLPLEDAYVKNTLTTIVKAQKKGEYAAKQLANVKSIEEAVSKGAISESKAVTFNDPSLEYKIAGIVASQKEGTISAPIVGTKGVYVVQVIKRTSGQTPYNENTAMYSAERTIGRFLGNYIFDLAKKAKITDNRYKF